MLVSHTLFDTSDLKTTLHIHNALFLQDSSRTSNLQAPNMLLTGHDAAVYSISFDPSGQHIASSSLDKHICEPLFHSPML